MSWVAANTMTAMTNLGVWWLVMETAVGRFWTVVMTVYALDWGKALRLLLEGAEDADGTDDGLLAAVT